MSALPPKADIERHAWHVRFVPKADIRTANSFAIRSPRRRAAETRAESSIRWPWRYRLCRTNVPSIISRTCLRISNEEVPLRLQSRKFRLNRYWVSRRSISSVRRPPDRARKRAISRSVCLCRDSTIARTIRLSRPRLWVAAFSVK